MTLNDYLNLIPQGNRDKPNFIATVTVGVDPLVYIQSVMNSLIAEFDIDTAVGVQLDVLGEWIGVGREIPIALDFYFTWDDTVVLGWDQGLWQGPFDPDSGTYILSDELYRNLLRSKIISNSWDGNLDTIYDILTIGTGVPASDFTVIDNHDMTMDVGTVDLTDLQQALVDQQILILKPVGVGITFDHQVLTVIQIDIEVDVTSGVGWDAGTVDFIKLNVEWFINLPEHLRGWDVINSDVFYWAGVPNEPETADTFDVDEVRLARLGGALLVQDVLMDFYEKANSLVVNILVNVT